MPVVVHTEKNGHNIGGGLHHSSGFYSDKNTFVCIMHGRNKVAHMIVKAFCHFMYFPGFVDQFKLLQKLSTVYHDNYRSLDHSYTLHRKLERKLENVDKQTTACGNRRSLTKSSPVYTAVHSLCLHLQAAMQRQVVICWY